MGNKDRTSITEEMRRLFPELREKYGVSKLWLFGSFARDEARVDSDVDVLVEFSQPGMSLFRFVEMEMYMSERLGVRVDLVTRPALKDSMRDSVLNEAIAV